MRISDWSSDVCSSDLDARPLLAARTRRARRQSGEEGGDQGARGQPFRGRPRSPARGTARRTHRRERSARRRSRSRSEEHTSELQSLMRISYAVFSLKKKKDHIKNKSYMTHTHRNHEQAR